MGLSFMMEDYYLLTLNRKNRVDPLGNESIFFVGTFFPKVGDGSTNCSLEGSCSNPKQMVSLE